MEARLTVEEGQSIGSQYTVLAGQTRYLGSGPEADIKLRDPALAPRHAAVRMDGPVFRVVDLAHPAGTLLNGERLQPQVPVDVQVGDAITLGGHVLRVELFGEEGGAVRGEQRTSRPEASLPGGEFQVLRELGCGAMGRVFVAVRRADGQQVAVKLLHESIEPGSPHHERFLREGQMCAQIQSPHIARVLDMRVEPGRTFIVMELVPGPSLEAVLIQRGPFPVPAALKVGEDVARALSAIAAAGIVHRDIKPANILLAPEGIAKLTDFGIAKDLQSALRSLTTSGQGLGTMAYLPPEQVSEAKHVDPRADIYSLGATLYHLLAGQPPFQPDTVQALFNIVQLQPPPLVSARPDCPPQVANQVHHMLEKDPFSRPPNARKLVRTLARLRKQLFPGYSLETWLRG